MHGISPICKRKGSGNVNKEPLREQAPSNLKRRLIRLGATLGALLVLLTPAYFAIGSYLMQKNAPEVDNSPRFDTLAITGPKGKRAELDDEHALHTLFLALMESGTKASEIPASHLAGHYTLLFSGDGAQGLYSFYFSTQSDDCYYTAPDGTVFLCTDKERTKSFLTNSFANELYGGAVLPVLTTAATDEVAPSLASWYYRTQSTFTELLDIPTTTRTLTYPIANDIAFYFSVQPNHHTVTIKENGTELYHGPSDAISLDLSDRQMLDFEIKATYDQDSRLDYYGTLTYRFRMQVVEAASFSLDTTSVEQGGILLFTCENVKNADKLQFSTTDGELLSPTVFSRNGAVLAAMPAAKTGEMTIRVTYGTVSKEFSVTVHAPQSTQHTAQASDLRTDWVTLLTAKIPELIEQKGAGSTLGDLVPKGTFFTGTDPRIFSYGDTVSVEGTALADTPLCFDLLRIEGDVYALSTGRVKEVGEDVLLGKYVIVDHGYGLYSWYAGLSEWRVSVGDAVAKGQTVGIAGTHLYKERSALIMATLGKQALSWSYLAGNEFLLA